MTRRAGWRASVVVGGGFMLLGALSGTASAADWLTGGQNLQNSRFQAAETTIGPANAASLAPKWQMTTGGDVSATPAVEPGTLYFPDSAGNLYAVDRANGAVRWQTSIAAATGIAGDYARATPAISGSTLIIGAQSGKFETEQTPANVRGGWVMAYNKATGALRWKTRVDGHFSAFVTNSAQVYKGVAYVGVASNEEAYANQLLAGGVNYECCSFRGSVVALDVMTGAIKWKTYMVPGDPGYSGSAVWGSTMPIDQARNRLYVATGNNYSLPPSVIACVQAAGDDDAAKRACMASDNLFDSIVALNLSTGAVDWDYNALPSDAWNTDCGLPGFPEDESGPNNCPAAEGPDYDFGQAPLLLKTKVNGVKTDVVGAGGKSGDFHLLNRATGELVWKTHVGPGGLTGGLQWGSATDGDRIYVAESNSTGLSRGWWSALDPSTGQILWTTLDPGNPWFPFLWGYSAQGPVSVANGLVYGCSLTQDGPMVAMNAATGAIAWQRDSGSSCLGGAAIADGTVYWGTGYRTFGPVTTGGNSVFAFTLGGA